jgi:hypothetical protein
MVNDLIEAAVVVFAFTAFFACFVGCSTPQPKNVRVLTAPVRVDESKFTIDDGDTILCDKSGCRVLR